MLKEKQESNGICQFIVKTWNLMEDVDRFLKRERELESIVMELKIEEYSRGRENTLRVMMNEEVKLLLGFY